MAKNIVAVLRGEEPKQYLHKNLGAVAGLGIGSGVFQSGKIAIKGVLAWFAHRGYHGLAMPSWERKFRVFWGWWNNFWLGRDIVSLSAIQQPRAQFEAFAARPKPPAEAAPVPAKADEAKAVKAPAKKAPAKAAAAKSTDGAAKADAETVAAK